MKPRYSFLLYYGIRFPGRRVAEGYEPTMEKRIVFHGQTPGAGRLPSQLLSPLASKIFLLSPANASGIRAKRLLAGKEEFGFTRQLKEGGVPLGELYSFLSVLYFRGKLAYARAFAKPPAGVPGILV